MLEKLKQIFETFTNKADAVEDLNELNEIKVKYLGKNGEIAELMKELKKCSPTEKPVLGKGINELRKNIETRINNFETAFKEKIKAKKQKHNEFFFFTME